MHQLDSNTKKTDCLLKHNLISQEYLITSDVQLWRQCAMAHDRGWDGASGPEERAHFAPLESALDELVNLKQSHVSK